MRLRLFILLVIALAAAFGAAASARDAEAGKPLAGPFLAGEASSTGADRCPLPDEYRDEFEHAADDADLPLALLVAVATVESNMRHDARSPAGAEGVLQVLPSTAAELDLDSSHLADNVLAGARYLRQMLDRFRSADLALAAYNAGPTAVETKGSRPNDETIAYVTRVTDEWRKLVGCT